MEHLSKLKAVMRGWTLLAGVAFGWQASPLAAVSPEKPNIVVILTDDWGHGDLGAFAALPDVQTPHLDRLASEGVLFTNGYVTSPQCAPSRAGLLTGRYQQRFGLDRIGLGPLPLEEITLADRLRAAGYISGMVGKWQLEPNPNDLVWARKNRPDLIKDGKITSLPDEVIVPYLPGKHGFQDFYCGELGRYFANFDRNGLDLVAAGQWERVRAFRVDVQTEAALAFIARQREKPFFLYLSYFAPHVPLEATQKYLDRFPGKMPERRRYALAMMSAVDDGVGRVLEALEKAGIRKKTLVIFASDNGAPLGAQQGAPMQDVLPVNKPGAAWNGSRNDPFRGGKGMLSEGGIRVPFIFSWPGTIPSGQKIPHPVSTLDIAATANSIAGLPDDTRMDGVDLIPYLTGKKSNVPHETLYWRFWNQAAVRSGDWKLIRAGRHAGLLFDLKQDPEETHDLAAMHPEKVQELHRQLEGWAAEMHPPELPMRGGNDQERKWYDYYFHIGIN